MTSPTIDEGRRGFALTGEFLSVKPGKPWKGRDEQIRQPWVASVLTGGDRVVQVEFRDEESAQAATLDVQRGEVVTLDVFVRAKGKDWLQVSGVNLRADD